MMLIAWAENVADFFSYGHDAMLGEELDDLIVIPALHVTRENSGIAQDHTAIGMADELIRVGILHFSRQFGECIVGNETNIAGYSFAVVDGSEIAKTEFLHLQHGGLGDRREIDHHGGGV